jgi:Ca2+-binding RTX toxin-like protein
MTIFTGTAGNDVLQNSEIEASDDLFLGLAGDDTITGYKGNDTLDGGDGNDYLKGYLLGNSLMIGGNGNDMLTYQVMPLMLALVTI